MRLSDIEDYYDESVHARRKTWKELSWIRKRAITIVTILTDLFNGWWSGFPLCCVLRYTWLSNIKNVSPGMYTDYVHNHLMPTHQQRLDTQFVMCKRHLKKLKETGKGVTVKEQTGGALFSPSYMLLDRGADLYEDCDGCEMCDEELQTEESSGTDVCCTDGQCTCVEED